MKHVFLTVICLLALSATRVSAQDELHKTYLLTPNGTVSITNVSGYIRITSWNENRVQVDTVKRGDQNDFSLVEIRVTDSPNRLEINTIYPRNFWRGRNHVEVNYDVKVPRGAMLDPITSTSGNIFITEAGSRVVARSTSGDISVRGISGDTSVTSTSGSVSAERVAGTLTITSTSGDIRINDVEAKVAARTTSGDLTASNIRNDTTAQSTSGDVRISQIGGRLIAQATSGSLSAKDVNGDANLQSISDSVTAENIKGRLTVTTVSADVRVQNVQQGVRVNAVSGTISLKNTKGLIEAKNTSGDILVQDAESREVLLNTHSGSINYKGSIFDDGRYSFESFNGNVIILIPASANFTLNASTYNGSIETDFPISVPPGMLQTNRPHRLQGSHGSSNGAQIKANGFSASIKLKKQ